MSFRFCSLSSGSSGNCQYIENKGTRLLVDAGLSGKRIQEALTEIEVDPRNLSGIVVTHEHKDHVKGVGILSRRFDIPIYANEGTWIGMEKSIGEIAVRNINIIESNRDFEIGDIGISTFDVCHDSNEPIGYSFYGGKSRKISIVMDTGEVDGFVKNKIKGSDILMVESNHDPNLLRIGSYPQYLKKRIMSRIGHLSNEDAGNLIVDIATKEDMTVILGHLSRENNFPELAYQTVKNITSQFNMDSLNIKLASRDRRTELFEL